MQNVDDGSYCVRFLWLVGGWVPNNGPTGPKTRKNGVATQILRRLQEKSEGIWEKRKTDRQAQNNQRNNDNVGPCHERR